MQPYFLPYLGYFQLMAAVDKFVVYDDVRFIKGGWINRNKILLNEREHLFTVPILGASPNRLIDELELAPHRGWRTKLLRSIEQAYRRAPQFPDVAPLLREIILFSEKRLTAFLLNSLRGIHSYLGMGTELIANSRSFHNSELSGQERVIDICLQNQADIYVNSPGGRELYDPAAFQRHGIDLRFVHSPSISYEQYGEVFHPNLSIIDVLMFNSRDRVIEYLDCARLNP